MNVDERVRIKIYKNKREKNFIRSNRQNNKSFFRKSK